LRGGKFHASRDFFKTLRVSQTQPEMTATHTTLLCFVLRHERPFIQMEDWNA
jgi:hypothetical protein